MEGWKFIFLFGCGNYLNCFLKKNFMRYFFKLIWEVMLIIIEKCNGEMLISFVNSSSDVIFVLVFCKNLILNIWVIRFIVYFLLVVFLYICFCFVCMYLKNGFLYKFLLYFEVWRFIFFVIFDFFKMRFKFYYFDCWKWKYFVGLGRIWWIEWVCNRV